MIAFAVMAMNHTFLYRNHDIETFASFNGRGYVASFRVRRTKSPDGDSLVRICDGQTPTALMAHAMAQRMARTLVDMMVDGAGDEGVARG